jgi:ligand-binding sensor domain-containing protein
MLLFPILLVQLFAGSNEAVAQQNRYPHLRNYSSDQGLASEEVHDILQDQKGYLWIATDNGVSRFDGYSFENYGAREGLKNNVVFYLQEDKEGRIWMQTMSGKVYYHWQDSIYPYAYNDIIQSYQKLIELTEDFMMAPDDWSYFALGGLGILRIDPNGRHEFINRSYPIELAVLKKPEFPNTLYAGVSAESRVFLGQDPSTTDQRADICIVGTMEDSLDNIYHLAVPSGNTRTTAFLDEKIHLFDAKQDLQLFINQELVNQYRLPAKMASIEKVDSVFWIGLNNRKGVRAYRGDQNLLSNQYDQYLSGQSISDVCRDQTGGYWFGTLEKGIFYAPNLELNIVGREEFKSEEHVLALETWKDGKILMGTNSGLVLSLDPAGRLDTLLSLKSAVFDLHCAAGQEEIWIGSSRLYIWEKGQLLPATYASYLGKDAYRNAVIAKGILKTRNDSVIYINNAQGLEMIDPIKRQVTQIPSRKDTVGSRRILAMYEDNQSRIWVGKIDGLFQYDKNGFSRPSFDHPVFHIRIEDIKQLDDGTIVLGTKGSGVALWKDTLITIIDENRGLTANMVENLAIDARQNIWVGTLNGLNLLKYNEQQAAWVVKRITMAHGLPSNGIYDLLPAGDGMYVATAEGVVKLPPDAESVTALPSPFVEQILVNGRAVAAPDLLHLKYNERNIQLRYVCINFKFDGAITYRYRLTSETDWSYTQDRSVNYAALSPGQYTFELQSQNEDWQWSEPLSIPFSIAKPFWQEWWFFLFLIGLFSLTAYLIYKVRIARLTRESAVEREIVELQRSALQAQMNPHFIFNCLNSIQNFIASGDKQNAMQYLSRFATLVRGTLNASAKDTITLEEELMVIENYLEMEKLRFGNKFDYEVRVDPEIDQFDISIPPLLVQPFVENAILHAFNFEDRNKTGKILISYEKDNGLLKITVRDNGIGVFHDRAAKEKAQQMLESLGMTITEKRLVLHNGPLIPGQFEVTELNEDNDAVTGTRIVIRMKI